MGRGRKPKNTNSPFAKLLVTLMEEKQLGVREAARKAGVSPSTIVSWRSGSHPEDYLAVKRLARALGVTLSFLLTGEEEGSRDVAPSIAEVFSDGGMVFDGYARIRIERLIPKAGANIVKEK